MRNWLREKSASEAFLLILFPTLLYGILGPLEIYAGNTDEFIFILKDFFWTFLLLSIIFWAVVSFILIVLPPKM